MKQVAIEFKSEKAMFDVLGKMGVKFMQSDSQETMCEADVTDEQEQELLQNDHVTYLADL
jgi:hypothetical protein